MPKKLQIPHFVSQSRAAPKRIAADIRLLKHPTRVHRHGFLELELVISGTGTQMLNGQTMKLSRGSVMLLRFNDYHSIVPDGQLELINISFDKELLCESLRARMDSIPGGLYRELDGEALKTIETLCRLLADEKGLDTAEPTGIYVEYAARLIECLLIKLLDFDFSENREVRTAAEPSPINTVLKYIRENFKNDPRLSDIAAELHYNPRYLSSLFAQKVGTTYSDYLKKIRLDRAKQLLVVTELNIDYVGMECGFNSASNFRRQFRESFGMSPGEFRQHSRG